MILNSKMQRLVSSIKFMVSLKISKLINHSILVMIKSNWDRSVEQSHRRTGHGSLGKRTPQGQLACACKNYEYVCAFSLCIVAVPKSWQEKCYLRSQWISRISADKLDKRAKQGKISGEEASKTYYSSKIQNSL